MFEGQASWTSLGVWLGLGIFGSLAVAQPTFPTARGPQFAHPAAQESKPSPAGDRFYFGVMGQVARPGVYERANPESQLVELLQHAGGLTQQATNQIRIVRQGNAERRVFFSPSLYFPLIPGDIVVADGPPASRSPRQLLITPQPRSGVRNADYANAPAFENAGDFRHVALMGVLDRPVILPVPETHATVSAVVKFLGQDPAVVSRVQVLPVGPERVLIKGNEAATTRFDVPTVLYFNLRFVQRDRLPKFPDLYRVELRAHETQRQSEEWNTADLTPSPSLSVPLPERAAVERFQQPAPFSGPELPGPSSHFPDPPIIAKIREQEQRIPSPAPLQTERLSQEQETSAPPVSISDSVSDNRGKNETEPQSETTSWWTIAGGVLLVLVPVGAYARWRWRQTLPDSSVAEAFAPSIPPTPKPRIPPEPRTQEPAQPALERKDLITEEILTALMFNRLPVLEEPLGPTAPETKEDPPKSRKFFRIDPPEAQAGAPQKKPFIAKPSLPPKPTQMRPAADQPEQPEQPPTLPLPEVSLLAARTPGTPANEAKPGPGLLDRVLQRVHQNRAA